MGSVVLSWAFSLHPTAGSEEYQFINWFHCLAAQQVWFDFLDSFVAFSLSGPALSGLLTSSCISFNGDEVLHGLCSAVAVLARAYSDPLHVHLCMRNYITVYHQRCVCRSHQDVVSLLVPWAAIVSVSSLVSCFGSCIVHAISEVEVGTPCQSISCGTDPHVRTDPDIYGLFCVDLETF